MRREQPEEYGMKRLQWIIRVAVCFLWCPGALAADPGDVVYMDGPEELIWFVAISDTHVGAGDLIYGDKDLTRLDWATSELVAVVDPAFIVNTGDLTDATAWGLVPTGQVETEWLEYRGVLDENGMASDYYHDVPGNHDHYGDGDLTHYLQWSVSGEAFGQTSHAWTTEVGDRQVLSLGIATCASDGAPSPFDNAGLDEADRAFISDSLDAHPDADLVLIFGHHPVYDLGEGKDFLEDVFVEDKISMYLYGHTHDYDLFWDLGTLHVNIRSLTKSENRQVGLVALDGRGLSARVYDEGEWPLVMVTAPLDAGLGGAHLFDYAVPWYMEAAPVRALAFHPDGVDLVELSIDGGSWTAMDALDEQVFQGYFDATVLDEYSHTLRVRAFPAGGGDPAEHEITIYIDPDAEPPEPPVAEETVEVVEPWTKTDVVEEDDAWAGEITEETMEPGWDTMISTDSVLVSENLSADGSEAGTASPIHPVPGGRSGGCARGAGTAPWWMMLLLALTSIPVRRRPATMRR